MKEEVKLALEALKYISTYHEKNGEYVWDSCEANIVSEACKTLENALEAHKTTATQNIACTRSHPHEEMSKECELRTEIARLMNQQTHNPQTQKKSILDHSIFSTPVNFDAATVTQPYKFYESPKPIGSWTLDPNKTNFCTRFMVYNKPTEDQIKNTEALLGWKWEDSI
jgi:hypothetical protein